MADTGLLLSNASATGSAKPFSAGRYCWAVDGTFGGATISLDMLGPDGSSYLTIAGSGFTAEGAVIVDLPAGRYRGLVAGGTPSALYASLKMVESGDR